MYSPKDRNLRWIDPGNSSLTRSRRHERIGPPLLAAACLLLDACRTRPPPAPAPPPRVVVPQRVDHYRIDAQASQVLILVYRDGPAAQLGHNHVLSVQQLTGEILWPADPAQASFSLQFPVAGLGIDDPELRAQLGADFRAPVDAASIAGTRAHMLGAKLLDAEHYPVIRIRSGPLRRTGDHWEAVLELGVRDREARVQVPVQVSQEPEQIAVSAEFDLTHAQLGLTPYSVALGALRVDETLHIRCRLLARRVADPADQPGR